MWNKQAQKARQLTRPAGEQEFCLTHSSDSSSNFCSSAVFNSAFWYRSHLPSFVNLFKSMRFKETKYDIPNPHVSNGPPFIWRHLVAKFPTNACGATCWLNLLAIRYLQFWCQLMGPFCLWQCLEAQGSRILNMTFPWVILHSNDPPFNWSPNWRSVPGSYGRHFLLHQKLLCLSWSITYPQLRGHFFRFFSNFAYYSLKCLKDPTCAIFLEKHGIQGYLIWHPHV